MKSCAPTLKANRAAKTSFVASTILKVTAGAFALVSLVSVTAREVNSG